MMKFNLIKLTLVCAGLLCGITNLWAQNKLSGERSIALSLQNEQMGTKTAESRLNEMLDLSNDFTFVKSKERTDNNGIRHITFAQYYAGIKVENGIVMLHSKGNIVASINGNIMTNPSVKPRLNPSIGKNEAFEIAKKDLNILKVTFSDTPELVFYAGAQGAALVYKTRVDGISAEKKRLMYHVYVSAISGKVLKKVSLIMHADVPGTATTYYSGVRPIITDSFSGGYRLRDNGRKIETYDVKGQSANQNGAPLFINPNDVINNSTIWSQKLCLTSVTLQKAADSVRFADLYNPNVSFRSGWFLDSKIEAFVPPTTFHLVKEGVAPPISSANISSPLALPVVDSGLDLPLNALRYRGTFQRDSMNIAIDPTTNEIVFTLLKRDTNVIEYTIDTLTIGVHNWTNARGDKGTYTIAFVTNPALDVHWGMEKTYDFYKNTFNYYSYNNDSTSVIKNYYHGEEQIYGDGQNAEALPAPYFAMSYGGGGSQLHPVVSLDVEGHEFTHLITASTSGLTYSGESGALNESFSDMMGTAVIYYAKGADSVTWLMGVGVGRTVPYFRSMSNPKSTASGLPQPDTYQGQYWADTLDLGGSNDNGGVHTNSGVGNKWFYLLAHGGSGINDNHYAYNITSLGMAKAQKIAFSTVTDYLTNTSKYNDAYTGSLQATSNIYGQNSTEYTTVKEAWKAVGIPKNATTGIVSQSEIADGIELSPNPSDGIVNIKSSLKEVVDATIHSITGAKLISTQVKTGSNKLDINSLSKGIYFIVYKVDNKRFTQKIVLR